MPDTGIDIYIDSSFFSVVSGTQDIYTSFIAGLEDNIGLRDTVADYQATPEISGAIGFPVEVYTSYSGVFQPGYSSISLKYKADTTTTSGMSVCLVDYSIPTNTSGLARTEDADLEYFITTTKISGAIDARLKFTGGQLYEYSDNILGTYWIFASTSGENDYEADYTAGGEYDPLIPGPPIDQVVTYGTIDIRQYFTTALASNSGTIQEECELFLAGYPMEFHPYNYTYKFDLVAGDEGSKQAAEWEATVISGSVLDIPLDVTSTAVTSGYYNFDLVGGLVDLSSYSFEGEVVSGTIGYFNGQAICGVSGTNGYGFDVSLLSLKISNFSLNIDEYTPASGTICVDITDDIHNVIQSGSYFIIDGTITSGTSFTPITDGYTMCYDSPVDFADILGATTFTVHAANDNGDILEQNFYITSGYVVEYDNITQDYGFGNQVVVMGSAENLASCPNTGADAYFFTTEPKYGVDLGATIMGMPFDRIVVTPSGAELAAVIGTQQYSAEIYDFENNVVSGISFTWSTNDGGTIDNSGFFTAGAALGMFEDVIVASYSDLEGYASVKVKDIETVYYYGKPFEVEVRAKDFAGNVMDPLIFEFKIEDKPE